MSFSAWISAVKEGISVQVNHRDPVATWLTIKDQYSTDIVEHQWTPMALSIFDQIVNIIGTDDSNLVLRLGMIPRQSPPHLQAIAHLGYTVGQVIAEYSDKPYNEDIIKLLITNRMVKYESYIF